MKYARLNKIQLLFFIFCNFIFIQNLYMSTSTIDQKLYQNNNNFQDMNTSQKKHRVEIISEIHACVMFRVWPGDEFAISYHDINDWMKYIFKAGVQTIHFYDNCQSTSECQSHLQQSENVEYKRWTQPNYPTAQISAITDCIDNVKKKSPSAWILSCDLDEYPFSFEFKNSGFLNHLVSIQPNETTQLLIRSWFFGGKHTERPKDKHIPIIEHYTYRYHSPEDKHHRTKPLFKPIHAKTNQKNIVHEIEMDTGETVVQDTDVLRINHYWGNRLDIETNSLIFDDSIVV